MFKDYDKYLRESLKVYLFLLVVICILKLVGLDYFGLDVNNVVMNKLSNAISTTHWGDLYNFVTIYIQAYFMLCLSTQRKKLYKETFIFTIIAFSIQIALNVFFSMNNIYAIVSIIWLIVFPMIINKKISWRPFIVVLLVTIYQAISLFIRSVGIYTNYNNFLIESILNLDQLLMLGITYNLHFMKGGITICDEWKDNFNNFLNWAIENGYKEGLTIDRINNDGNYEPNNCKWSTRAEQNRNMRKKTNFIKRYLLNVK